MNGEWLKTRLRERQQRRCRSGFLLPTSRRFLAVVQILNREIKPRVREEGVHEGMAKNLLIRGRDIRPESALPFLKNRIPPAKASVTNEVIDREAVVILAVRRRDP